MEVGVCDSDAEDENTSVIDAVDDKEELTETSELSLCVALLENDNDLEYESESESVRVIVALTLSELLLEYGSECVSVVVSSSLRELLVDGVGGGVIVALGERLSELLSESEDVIDSESVHSSVGEDENESEALLDDDRDNVSLPESCCDRLCESDALVTFCDSVPFQERDMEGTTENESDVDRDPAESVKCSVMVKVMSSESVGVGILVSNGEEDNEGVFGERDKLIVSVMLIDSMVKLILYESLTLSLRRTEGLAVELSDVDGVAFDRLNDTLVENEVVRDVLTLIDVDSVRDC